MQEKNEYVSQVYKTKKLRFDDILNITSNGDFILLYVDIITRKKKNNAKLNLNESHIPPTMSL